MVRLSKPKNVFSPQLKTSLGNNSLSNNQESGLLIINKPAGPTSFHIVSRVTRQLGGIKAGHCGTLDPLASGVLLVLFGQARKMQSELTGCNKTYRLRARFGITTDTGDISGRVKNVYDGKLPEFADLLSAVKHFQGEMEQVPPMYSAVKINGMRLYTLARQGIEVERKPRQIVIHSSKLVSYVPPEFELFVDCSSGTYIRTLVEDIGGYLGCGATLTALIREKAGNFTLQEAIDMGELERLNKDEIIARSIRVEKLLYY